MTVRRFGRFSVVGVANTLIHMMVAWGLVWGLNSPLLTANTIAFFVANLISFVANARLTFGTAVAWRRYPRFLMVSLTSLLASSVLVALAGLVGIHYLLAIAASALLSAALGFALSRSFVFLRQDSFEGVATRRGVGQGEISSSPNK
jgi:putative flippase GtrA